MNLISSMLKLDVRKRPSAKEVLKDKWFHNVPEREIDRDLLKSALSNMKQMSYSSKLQQMTMQLMIKDLLPKEEEDRLKHMFR